MKIFIVTQEGIYQDYDTYDSFVCYAETEEQARLIGPGSCAHEYREGQGWGYTFQQMLNGVQSGPEIFSTTSSWKSRPEDLTVEYIGEAPEGVKPGVILASFNAG